MDLQSHPAFSVLAICSAVLVAKMMVVGHYTGIVRIRRRAYLNPEDAAAFSKSTELVGDEDPQVARGLRAHRNDLESTLPFLVIAPLYLLMGAPATLACGLFVAFTCLRCLFSVFYLAVMQPWRSLSFVLAEACLLLMLAQIIYWGLTS